MNAKRAILALAALAQETRLAIFRLLVQRGPEGLAAGDIAEKLGLPASSLSFHLAQLSHAGMIAQRRQSRSLIYSVDFAAMNDLMAFLTENCCGGSADLCALARRSGLELRDEGEIGPHLASIRAKYEPYAAALARTMELPLPAWMPDPEAEANWRRAAWHRGRIRALP